MALGRDRRAQVSEDRAPSLTGVLRKPCRTQGPGIPCRMLEASPDPRPLATWRTCLPQACSPRRGWDAASVRGAQAQRGDHHHLSWRSGAPSSAWSLPTCPFCPPAGVRGRGASGLSLPSLHTLSLWEAPSQEGSGSVSCQALPGATRDLHFPSLWLCAASLMRGPGGCPSTDSNLPSPTGPGPPGL